MNQTKHTELFPLGKHNITSITFTTPAFIAGFHLSPDEYETDDVTGKETGNKRAGDYITFERLLFDGVYDINCGARINEAGIAAAAAVRNECGEEVRLDYCHNALWLTDPGIYRAVFHGNAREQAAVILYNGGN